MKLSKVSIYFSLVLFFILCTNYYVIVEVKNAYKVLVSTYSQSQSSIKLINSLNAETLELSQLVRLYTSTNDTRYLFYYYDLIAIREGMKAAPKDYFPSIYWADVIAKRRIHEKLDRKSGVALSTKMKSLGFSNEEFRLLDDVLSALQALNNVEQIVFAATQGLYDSKTKEYVSDAKEDLAYANELLNSEQYNREKANLSHALHNLSNELETRTNKEIQIASNLLIELITRIGFVIVFTLLFTFLAYLFFRRFVLGPISLLSDVAKKLSNGKYQTRVNDMKAPEELLTLGNILDVMSSSIEKDIKNRNITQRNLEEANLIAQEATQTKSMFLANMSHEIRTPMNAIIGMAYLALKTKLSSQQKNYVETIHNAGQSLLNIINDILDFSKIEAGKIELEQTAFKLEDVVRNSLALIKQDIETRDIEILAEIKAPLLLRESNTLIGDPVRLGQIFNNLLSNAIKFTSSGYIVLTIDAIKINKTQATINFSVEDTGIGMTDEQVGRLFREFEQADSSTTRKYGGTGLGLTISKTLVELMGGNIDVKSAPDIGSTFSFNATFNLPEQIDIVVPHSDIENLKVLIIDDKPKARIILKNMMQDLGVGRQLQSDIKVVDNGFDALDILNAATNASAPYDIVFLDWVMPGMTGEKFLLSFKKQSDEIKTKIVIVSSYDYESMHQSAQQHNIKQVLSKPVLPDILRNLLDSMVSTKTNNNTQLVNQSMHSLKGINILLVEDNKTNQQLAIELLEMNEAKVDVVNNGQEAVDKILYGKADQYDVVLMDLQMPIMDGYEATRIIRENSRFNHLPIVAMSAHAMVEDVKKSSSLGMNAHIAKPIVPILLYSTIYNLHNKIVIDDTTLNEPEHNNHLLDTLNIDGLDVVQGLKNVNGKESLYFKILASFVNDYSDLPIRFPVMIKQKNWKEAELTAHSLAGLTGTIGATKLIPEIKKLEYECKNKNSLGAEKTFKEILLKLTPFLVDLQNIDTGMESIKTSISIGSSGNSTELLTRLKSLLESGDADAIDKWNDNYTLFSNMISEDVMAHINQAINSFDFENALHYLNQSQERKVKNDHN